MEDELLSDEELEKAILEAEVIENRPAKKYNYANPSYKGGPRNKSQGELEAAAIELAAARLVVEDFEASLLDARILLYDTVKKLREEGFPVEFIAEYSGLRYRSRVYTVISSDLPKLLKRKNNT